ncbi:MAG: hypothetical protein ABR927_14865 [Bacteroidales bacterium]
MKKQIDFHGAFHATLSDFDRYIKMNEILAGEGLKKFAMFQ